MGIHATAWRPAGTPPWLGLPTELTERNRTQTPEDARNKHLHKVWREVLLTGSPLSQPQPGLRSPGWAAWWPAGPSPPQRRGAWRHRRTARAPYLVDRVGCSVQCFQPPEREMRAAVLGDAPSVLQRASVFSLAPIIHTEESRDSDMFRDSKSMVEEQHILTKLVLLGAQIPHLPGVFKINYSHPSALL